MDNSDRVVATVDLESRGLHAVQDGDPLAFDQFGQPEDRFAAVGKSALTFVQHGACIRVLPIGEQFAEVVERLLSTFDKGVRVAGRGMAAGDLSQVIGLMRTADGHVSHGVIVQSCRVFFPDIYTLRHDRRHGWLKIIAADDATGNPASAGRHAGLV